MTVGRGVDGLQGKQGSGEVVGALAIAGALEELGHGRALEAMSAALEVVGRLADQLSADEQQHARAVVVGRVWQGLGVAGAGPDRFEGRGWWLARFRELGWVHPWERGARPAGGPFGTVRLFRGAPVERREGLSWTPSLEVAEWFATRWPRAVVWRADVPAGRLLCAFPLQLGDGIAGTEYVVDVSGVAVGAVS